MTSGNLSSKVEIYVSASGLKRLDLLSKSDPFVVLQQEIQGRWVDIDRTEVIKDNQNPRYDQMSFAL
jgi:Ca2+-dependent lipid-binding protein